MHYNILFFEILFEIPAESHAKTIAYILILYFLFRFLLVQFWRKLKIIILSGNLSIYVLLWVCTSSDKICFLFLERSVGNSCTPLFWWLPSVVIGFITGLSLSLCVAKTQAGKVLHRFQTIFMSCIAVGRNIESWRYSWAKMLAYILPSERDQEKGAGKGYPRAEPSAPLCPVKLHPLYARQSIQVGVH